MKKLLILLLCLGLVGCASTMPWNIGRTRRNLMKLEIGMTKQEVINIMGEPYDREAYKLKNGQTLDFLIYLTKYTYADRILDSDTTPICLQDGKVTGWGRNFYVNEKKRYEIKVNIDESKRGKNRRDIDQKMKRRNK